MVKIPRITDRYKLNIGEVTFELSPLTFDQKTLISECTKIENGETVIDLLRSQKLHLKYGLKNVSGIEYCDGEKFELKFDNGVLADESIDEIMNLPQKQDLINVAWQVMNGVPDKLVDPFSGKVLKGIKLEIVSGKPQKQQV